MKKELTGVYCGIAKGKTTLALGHSLRAAAEGKSVIIIQFLKGKETCLLYTSRSGIKTLIPTGDFLF